jgi:2,4-dienoyl-CoA reductase [(3E)-enoyl-CoA-producing], peroxisomal
VASVSSFRPDLLRGRAAFVTGGGTGIGAGIARALARHGAAVAIASRKAEHLEPTAREIAAAGGKALVLPVDVRDAAAVEQAVSAAASSFGRLDIVVNGAAGNFVCRAEDLSPNGFGTVVDIDLKGSFHVARAARPHLARQGGVVLNISATLHYLGTAAQLHVSAAKAGLDALTRTLAVEWGPYGIRVNGVAPGPIDGTEGVRRLLDGEKRERAVRLNPLRRLGTIDDVADACLFLCSDAAAFVNGVTLVVDGGQWLASYRVSGEPAPPGGGG